MVCATPSAANLGLQTCHPLFKVAVAILASFKSLSKIDFCVGDVLLPALGILNQLFYGFWRRFRTDVSQSFLDHLVPVDSLLHLVRSEPCLLRDRSDIRKFLHFLGCEPNLCLTKIL